MRLTSLFLLSVLIHLCVAYEHRPHQFWFTTSSKSIELEKDIDFRGCYGSECVYVSSIPAPNHTSTILKLYRPSEKLWAVGDTTNGEHVKWVFSNDRPQELSTTLWAIPVVDYRVVPSVFDARPYLAMDPDPHVAEFISNLNSARMQAVVGQLSSYNSRNSQSPDMVQVSGFLKTYMEDKGCQNVQLLNFRANYAPNVVCEIPGTDPTAPAVLVGAHYDSRSTNVNSPTQRAPGADDNGSGSAAVLDILVTATELIESEGYSFERKIIFALFAGEEQGLVGSAALATQYVNAGVELEAMVNLDMIGYPDPAFPTTLYWMSGSTTSALTQLAINLARTYLGENTLLSTTGACCSDQQSFYSRGYPAASIFESRSAFSNPNYHQSSDLPATVNFNHVLNNAKSAAALITTLAGVSGPL